MATTPRLTLPSGSTISADTWEAITTAGTWRGFLDARMYAAPDRAFMDDLLAKATA